NNVFEIDLSRPSSSVMEMIEPLRQAFDNILQKHVVYRSTGVILCNLKTDKKIQLNIFEDPVRMVKMQHIDDAVDKINNLFGRNTVHLASTMPANYRNQGNKGAPPKRQQNLLKGEIRHKRINMPLLEIRSLH
ncbi:hypothetical protein KJ708_10540, partial [bacterium]|nr:hypothetical protein [bacterium]